MDLLLEMMILRNDRRMKCNLIKCWHSIIIDTLNLLGLNCSLVKNGGVVLATQIVLDCVQ